VAVLFWSTRLKKVEEELTKLKRMVEDRDLDWVDMRSRCKRLLDRTEKAAKLREPESDQEAVAPAQSVPDGNYSGRLTERQRQIQQAILRKRAGL
jgi:hypothetical protein